MSADPSAPLTLDFLIESETWRSIDDLDGLIDKALYTARDFVMAEEAIAFTPEVEISLVFTDDAAIRQLNSAHRGKDKPTNVLSFPIDEDLDIYGPMLGDIVFAHETIGHEASQMGVAIEAHLTHLCVHGFLHLLGYDHMNGQEADKMEHVEIAILALLGYDNPYEGTILTDLLD